MSKTPTWRVDTDAYLADTAGLRGATQHGAYLLILMALWRSKDGTLPGNDESLARTTHMTLDKWRRIAPVIRGFLVDAGGGRVTQKRSKREKDAANHPSQRPSWRPSQRAGKASKSLKSKAPKSGGGGGQKSVPSLNLSFLESEDSKASRESPSKRGSKREGAGISIPDDWKPSEKSRLWARSVLKLSDEQIDRHAATMRRWAEANKHRREGRKAGRRGWDLTFDNWMERDLNKNGGGNGRRTPTTAARELVDGIRSGALSVPPEPKSPSAVRREGETAPRVLPPGGRERP